MPASDASDASRVVVTGYGTVSACGHDVGALLTSLRDTRSGIGRIGLFDVSAQKTQIGAEVRGFRVADIVPRAHAQTASRTDALALAAASQALRSANLRNLAASRTGLILGGTTGGMLESEECLSQVPEPEATRRLFTRLDSHALAATSRLVGEALEIRDLRRTICTACSSSAHAIAVARDLLLRGALEVAFAGGADALCRLTYSGFNALGAMDPDPCRPFDATRAGLNLGEGAAVLVLERLDHARARGAEIRGEIVGAGIISEAHHVTHPMPSGAGAARAITLALQDARLEASEVGYVNAHGTATQLNDVMESRALRLALGEHCARVVVSSTKSITGHTLGAAGAIEAAVTLLALEHRFAPATAGLASPDAACELRHVVNATVRLETDIALSNSFGFGGSNVVLALGSARFVERKRTVALRAARRVVVTGVGAWHAESATAQLLLDVARGTRSEPAAPPSETLDSVLDASRSRRFDDVSSLATATGLEALRAANLVPAGQHEIDDAHDANTIGISVATTWGAIDASAAFLRRIRERGPRLAPPADFPQLVLSAAAGNASIYLRSQGPALTTVANETSSCVAVTSAIEEITSNRAEAMCAVSVEGNNPIVLDRYDAQVPREGARWPRRASAGAIVLESEPHACARGAAIQATVTVLCEFATSKPTPNDGGLISPEDLARAIEAIDSALERTGGDHVPVYLFGRHAESLADVIRERDARARVINVRNVLGSGDGGGSIAMAAAVSQLAGHPSISGAVVFECEEASAIVLFVARSPS